MANSARERVIDDCHLGKEEGHPENVIRNLLGTSCVFCSPEEWESQYSKDCLKRLESGEKGLLLFDNKLGDIASAEGEGRSGIGLDRAFGQNESVKDNTYCGIISQQIKLDGDESEFKFRKRIGEEFAAWAFPISKDRLPKDEDYSKFIEGMNNLLWVGYVDRLSDVAKSLIASASKKLEDAFSEIMPLEFKQMVVNSSRVEGCRELDTLLRLIHIVFQKSLTEHPDGIETINKNVESIKAIDDVVKDKLSLQYDSKLVRGFFQDETFIPGPVINELLTPLQNGDVFCVNKKKYYVLLCQPCNISLRDKGRRGNDYDIGYLVPLHKSDAEQKLVNELDALLDKTAAEQESAKVTFIKNLKQRIREASQGYLYGLKCTINGQSMSIAINEYKTVSLSLLDYCTFSEDGAVIINKPYSSKLHNNQKLLYKNHTERFRKELNIEHMLDGLDDDVSVVVRPRIQSWYYSLLANLGINPDCLNRTYAFPIKRFGHIQDQLASDLLIQLSHYISRAGLPSAFDR